MPQVTAQEIVRFLRRHGFEDQRQRGSHLILVHPVNGRRGIVPMHRGDLGRGTAQQILAGAGFSVDDYLRLR
jgi:predicted RNA binding protein YcfA (HicA-like mRNA interferase family)